MSLLALVALGCQDKLLSKYYDLPDIYNELIKIFYENDKRYVYNIIDDMFINKLDAFIKKLISMNYNFNDNILISSSIFGNESEPIAISIDRYQQIFSHVLNNFSDPGPLLNLLHYVLLDEFIVKYPNLFDEYFNKIIQMKLYKTDNYKLGNENKYEDIFRMISMLVKLKMYEHLDRFLSDGFVIIIDEYSIGKNIFTIDFINLCRKYRTSIKFPEGIPKIHILNIDLMKYLYDIGLKIGVNSIKNMILNININKITNMISNKIITMPIYDKNECIDLIKTMLIKSGLNYEKNIKKILFEEYRFGLDFKLIEMISPNILSVRFVSDLLIHKIRFNHSNIMELNKLSYDEIYIGNIIMNPNFSFKKLSCDTRVYEFFVKTNIYKPYMIHKFIGGGFTNEDIKNLLNERESN